MALRMKVDAIYQVHWANSLSNLAFAERCSKAVSTRSTLITSGLYKNNFTRGFFVLSVATVNMAKMVGRAASFIANIATVAPGTSPMPPVRNALTAPKMEMMFQRLRRSRSHVPYPMGNKTAKTRMTEPTSGPSLGASSNPVSGSPSQSSPFRRIKIGRIRLNPKFSQIFSRFGFCI